MNGIVTREGSLGLSQGQTESKSHCKKVEKGVIAFDGTRDIIDSSDPLAVRLEEAEKEGVTDPETVKAGLGEAVTERVSVEL